MKNLNVIRSRILDLKKCIVGMCFDADNGDLFFLTKELEIFKVQADDEISKLNHDFDFSSIGLKTLSLEDVKFIDFIVESGSLLVVLAEGHIIRIGISSYSLSSEKLYTHDCGISSFKLSPDQDRMVLADQRNNIHVLSSDCEIIYSANALTQNESLHKPVGVGWGSKETQFFGLDGRPSKEDELKNKSQYNDEKLVDLGEIENGDILKEFHKKRERTTVIDWRGDGQYIASLTFLEDTKKHCLKVWNRNLELQYMSEKLVTVEQGLLSWIPNGQYICCGQHREANKNDIAMFEKNGMVHQRLSLPSTASISHISDLAWSPDSKILAIIVCQFVLINQQVVYRPVLMLYTMQNFHYYLKYSCKLETNNDHSLRWNPVSQNRLHLVSSDGCYSEFNCNVQVSFSEDLSSVAVLDGNRVLITPFELCNIPPPMSAIEVECTSLINKFTIDPCSSHVLYIMTMDDHLIKTGAITKSESDKLKVKTNNRVVHYLHDRMSNSESYEIPDVESFQYLTAFNTDQLVASRSSESGCELFKIEFTNHSKLELKMLKKFENQQIACIPRHTQPRPLNILVILSDKSVTSIDLSSGETKVLFQFNQIEKISSHSFLNAGVKRLGQIDNVVTLDKELTLRFNEFVIASNCCTSFHILENYLTYTTTDNNIHFVLMSHLLEEKIRCIIEPPSQTIEIGGTLVNGSESESKVILQMPRGNLEILHPRVLVFSAITKLLDKGEYVSALKMARRHRISMNFLADYLLYLSKVPEDLNVFANRIAEHNPALLNLFLTELDDKDSLVDRYGSTVAHLPPRLVNFEEFAPLFKSDKVNHICSLITLPDEDRFIQPTLLCYLKRKPRLAQEALSLVFGLGRGSNQTEALKFMLYFIDIDQLFYEALCTYDTDITLMVASVSNKDPKEYLALLDDFNKIENKFLRCHTIDMHLKRYEKAFDSLIMYFNGAKDQAEVRNQLVDLVVSKRLFKHALRFLNSGDPNLPQDATLLESLWSRYATYLWEKRYYPEAGFSYSKAFEYNAKEEYYRSAKRCYSMVDEWEKILALAARFNRNDKGHTEEIMKLTDQLLDNNKFTDAMIIQSQFLQRDKYRPKEFQTCLNLGLWYVADTMASYLEDKSELKKEIRQALLEALLLKVARAESELKKAKSYFARLKILLDSYHNKESEVGLDGNIAGDSMSTIDGSEISSVASSNHGKEGAKSGVASIKTRTSSKNNKAQANRKKRINLREGSRHEDLALILEIKKFIAKQKSNQDETRNIVAAFYELTRELSGDLGYIKSLNNLCQESLTLSLEMLESLWPQTAQSDRYSLYERFSRKTRQVDENVDFEVLIRPEVSNDIHLFELST